MKTLEEQAIEMMKQETNTGDTEHNHAEADRILIWLLRKINCHELADLYEKMDKWYA